MLKTKKRLRNRTFFSKQKSAFHLKQGKLPGLQYHIMHLVFNFTRIQILQFCSKTFILYNFSN